MSIDLNPAVVLAALDNILEPPSTHRMTHLSIMRLRVKRLRDQVAQYVPVGHQFDGDGLKPVPSPVGQFDHAKPLERQS